MAIQVINIGSSANKGDGDPLRTAFKKINENFAELDVTNTVKDIKGSVFADDSTVLVDSVNGTLNASALSGSLPAIDGSALTGVTATTLAFSALTGTPTTLAGYGITDAATLSNMAPTGAVDFTGATSVDFTGATVNGLSVTETDPVVGAITGIVKADGSGNISAAVAGTDYLTTVAGTVTASLIPDSNEAYDLGSNALKFRDLYLSGTSINLGGATITASGATVTLPANSTIGGTDTISTFDGAFSSLTGKPTTIAGYGITDALQIGTSATTALAGNTTLFSGAFADLTSKPTTLAGYGITDAATLSNMAPTGAVDFTGATTIDFNTVTINNLEFADISAKPTTLAGYGITDAVSTSGGNINLADDEKIIFGTDDDLQVWHTGADGIIQNATGELQLRGNTIRLLNAATTKDLAYFNNNGSVDLYYDNVKTFATSAAGIQIEQGVEEKFATTNGATGVTALDCDTGHVHYLTAPAGDITANFTNFGLTAEYATNLTVIINQGATPYEVTAVQIGGAAQTINWQGGSQPTGNANGIDSFSFTILNDGGSYVVLGQMVDFT